MNCISCHKLCNASKMNDEVFFTCDSCGIRHAYRSSTILALDTMFEKEELVDDMVFLGLVFKKSIGPNEYLIVIRFLRNETVFIVNNTPALTLPYNIWIFHSNVEYWIDRFNKVLSIS